MNKPKNEATVGPPATGVFPQTRGWIFDVTEVYAGVHEVICHDRAGWVIAATGLDPDALIEGCKAGAIDMMTGARTSVERGSRAKGEE